MAYWGILGKLEYVDKEKALNYLHHSAPIAEALSNPRLISTTKVIQKFENPKIEPRYNLRDMPFFDDGGTNEARYSLSEKEVSNVVLTDAEDKKLPSNRKEAFEYIPQGGISIFNGDIGANINVGRKAVKHTALHHQEDEYAIFAGIRQVVENAVKVGNIPVAKDEIGHTPSVNILYVPINVNGTQYSARLLVKELENKGVVIEELSLYNVSMHKERGSAVQPLSASDEVGGITAKPQSFHKVKELIHNSQEIDKKNLGINEITRFSLQEPIFYSNAEYAKKWGATVGEVTMPDLEENNTMHSVDVTPAMRESVMQGQPKFSLRDAETEKIFATAKEKFGTTYDMREAGYILPDGSMLDFSGKHQVRDTDTSFLNGNRTVDHREIADIAYDFDENETGVETDMGDFLDRGAIRIDSNAGAINLNVAPTKAQKDRLKRLIERNDGYVYIDFGKGWDTEHYAEYEAARASRVLGDIDRYFDEGIKPTGNVRFSLRDVNDRFNEELDAFKAGQNISELHLGVPSPLLRACGVSASEIFITAKTLREHLKKHNLTEDEIKNLPIAINDPIMVYEWGEKAKSKIIITQIPRGEQRITVAIKMERGGRRLSVNELASVHGKDVERLMNEMLTTKSDFGQDNLKYVNKEIAMQWLGIAPPEGAASLTDAQQSIANIIQNFENPKIEASSKEKEIYRNENAAEQISGSDNSHLYARQPRSNYNQRSRSNCGYIITFDPIQVSKEVL